MRNVTGRPTWSQWFAVVGGFLFAVTTVRAVETPAPAETQETRLQAILDGEPPQTLADLKAMEQHVRLLTERVMPAVVGIQVGSAQGSGVIVTRDGYVLTAAHVIGKSGQRARVFLADGQRVGARTLGTYLTADTGLLKLDPPNDDEGTNWPHLSMGSSKTLALGQWCLALGHPGGIQDGRQPALRLGRILNLQQTNTLTTDCTLIGGDSGGPLIDMQGRIVGIHSRIGNPLTANLHIPVDLFQDSWERLARGDNWGHTPGQRPYLGVQGEAKPNSTRLTQVFPKSPAEKAGLLPDDRILTFNGQPVADFTALQSYVEDQQPGAKVTLEVQRGDARLKLEVVMGRIRE